MIYRIFAASIFSLIVFTSCTTMNTATPTSIIETFVTAQPTKTVAPTATIEPTRPKFPTPNYESPVYLRTKIINIKDFLEKCPTNDPAYKEIRHDIIIRVQGKVIGDIFCSEPTSAIPLDLYTPELIIVQALRTIYYMDTGTPNYLPWTSDNFYTWVKSNIDGIDVQFQGNSHCCKTFSDGKKYMTILLLPGNRDLTRDWHNPNGGGIATIVDLIAHEVRHASGGPGHPYDCGSLGQCDATYDLDNLGSFGVQTWLYASWVTGYLNIGYGCLPENDAYRIINMELNYYRKFILTNPPPVLEMPLPPYGGPCFQ